MQVGTGLRVGVNEGRGQAGQGVQEAVLRVDGDFMGLDSGDGTG